MNHRDPTVVSDHLDVRGDSHLVPDADQIGFGAEEPRQSAEDAVVTDDNPVSAHNPQAKTPVAELLTALERYAAIAPKIREYLSRNFLFSDQGFEYEDDASFLELGIIDSFGFMEAGSTGWRRSLVSLSLMMSLFPTISILSTV